MPSASSPVKQALEGYVAGRLQAERLVAAVATAYYRDDGRGMREALRPVVEVIERAAPGVVELVATTDRPGFAIRLAERPFPQQYVADLRSAAAVVLNSEWGRGNGEEKKVARRDASQPGFFVQVLHAIGRLLGRP